MDLGTSTLRVLQAVAENGSISAAARSLGYSQSAVSRQISSAEHDVGMALFHRGAGGVQPTRAGATVLRHVSAALLELDLAAFELSSGPETGPPLRIGAFPSAAVVLFPEMIRTLRGRVDVVTRERSSVALVRAVRSGSLDLAIVSQRPPFRPLDLELPPLPFELLLESELLVAVAADGPYGGRSTITAGEAAEMSWIAPSQMDDPHLGVWPGLPGRPRIAHRTTDWLTRLRLVAAGGGVTTIPTRSFASLVPGVTAVSISDVPPEVRRIGLVRSPATSRSDASAVEASIRAAAELL